MKPIGKLELIAFYGLFFVLVSANQARADSTLKEAFKHYKQGNAQAVVKLLTPAVEGTHKGSPTAHYYLGNAWMRLGQRSKAPHRTSRHHHRYHGQARRQSAQSLDQARFKAGELYDRQCHWSIEQLSCQTRRGGQEHDLYSQAAHLTIPEKLKR